MDCRIIKVEQGSDEWLELRRGRITASRLGDVMAKPTTKRYQQYMKEKVLELLGNRNVEEAPEWARHGRENEPRALAAYEWKHELDVDHNCFLISNKHEWLACSPDFLHLPEYDAGGEIKCRALYKNYRDFRQIAHSFQGHPQCVPASNRRQVQTAMWVTGFDRWAWVNYYIGEIPGSGDLTQNLHRVWCPRDDKMIAEMYERAVRFMAECYERAGM